MKRTAIILAGLLALLHIAGITPFYIAALQVVKQEITIELGRDGQLQPVRISNSEMADATLFNRHNESEFTYRGKLYDFARMERTADGCVFYALEDEKESALQAMLCLIYSHPNKGLPQSPLGKLIKECCKDYLIADNPLKPLTAEVKFLQPASQQTQSNLMKGHYNTLINPPDNRNTPC